jgi:hypothetical protein
MRMPDADANADVALFPAEQTMKGFSYGQGQAMS